MKILLCHNHYLTRAGEDQVFAAELQLLRNQGHVVITYTRDNAEIGSFSPLQKLLALCRAFYNPKTVRDITAIVRREQPDLAHVHNVFPLISPALYCTLKKLHVPVVQTIHNFRFFCCNGLLFHAAGACPPAPPRFLRCVLRRCYRNSALLSAWYAAVIRWHRFRKTFRHCIDRYIVLNSFTRDIFLDNGFDRERIIVKPNAVAAPELPPAGTHDYLVFIGRFSSEKGILTLIDALTYLPAVPVKLIGDGPLYRQVTSALSAANLSQVDMPGYLPFDECCRAMAGALVTIFPSECYENCPLTVITSLWYGTPVLATNIGGLPDFVPETAGWLFEAGNAEALAERLQWIYSYRHQVLAMRPAVKAYARERFSPERTYLSLQAVYHSVVSDAMSGDSCA